MRFALFFLLRTQTPEVPPASERSWEARVRDPGAEAVTTPPPPTPGWRAAPARPAAVSSVRLAR